MKFLPKKINFLPWVGNVYMQGVNGQRVLLLGESHYQEPIENRNATNDYTDNFVENGIVYRSQYWKNITEILANKPFESISSDERKRLWNKFCFYNFIQFEVGATKVPNSNDYINSEPMFLELIEALKPDKILVLMKRLWYNLEFGGEWINSYGNLQEPVWKISHKGKTAHCWAINHPSYIFSIEKRLAWAEKVDKFLKA